MSLPEFPSESSLTREEAINQIISSIAMEELGLSHIINAEGEKMQYILGTIPGLSGPDATIEDVLKVNDSVRSVLQSATESQSLLRNKLQNALSSAVLTGPTGPIGPTGPTGPATITVGSVTGLEPGEPPSVTNTGTPQEAQLDFGIPRGATGAIGVTGATGTADLAAYGTYVSTAAQNLAIDAPVALNASLGTAPVGMTHAADASTVNITNPGVYRIDYRISTTTGTGTTAVVSLLHNGQAIPNSGVPVAEEVSKVSGVAIMTLATNDTIAIGTSVAAVNLPAVGGAFLDIIQIATV